MYNIFESLGGCKNREERLNTAITNSVYQQNDIKMEKDFKKYITKQNAI